MRKGFLTSTQLALTMLLGLLTAPGVMAAPPTDDTDAEAGDRFGDAVARGDFNGDGYEDLAVGVAQESFGSDYGAGAVEVIYGTVSGLTSDNRQFLFQGGEGVEDVAEWGDHFGAALAVGDFDADGYDDLAIGVPQERVGDVYQAGAVNVIYGTASGLSATTRADQFWHQDVADVVDDVEWADSFGWSLATGDFNGDGWDDLAIGVPREALPKMGAAGIVHVLYGSPVDGLSATYLPNVAWSQDAPNMLSPAESGDYFGWSLAAGDFNGDKFDDLAIGVPGEDIVDIYEAGAVDVIYGTAKGLSTDTGTQFWHQDVAGVGGNAQNYEYFGWALAVGDFNGDKVEDLAIGVPFDSDWVMWKAGVVNVAYGSARGLSATELWHQDTANVEDVAESGDNFGSSLAAGDFNADGFSDLAIGVPEEIFGDLVAAGAVNVIYGSSSGLDPRAVPNQFWHQDVEGVEDDAGPGDHFGGFHLPFNDQELYDYSSATKLAAGDFNGDGRDDLAIGVPHEDLEAAPGSLSDAGAVNVIYGWVTGLNTAVPISDQFWTQVFISPPPP